MTAAILTGCGVGAGLALLLVALWPAQRSLGSALAMLRAPSSESLPLGNAAPSWQAQLGHTVMRLTQPLGLDHHRLRADLALLDRSLPSQMARKTLWAAGAGLAVPVLRGLLDLGQVHVPWLAQTSVALGAAVAGFALPDRLLQTAARRRRAHLRYTVAALLNLVAINLAGGAEVEEAIHNATRLGDSWGFTLLRQHLDRARLARTKVWAAWAQLGHDLDVAELRQLAQQVAIAGDEGARMRQALVAMAGSLRDRELAEAEVRAGEASEHMVLPLTLLGGGFLLFLVIPALSRVLATFGL
jgi:Flp pilus assembly protein TadB